LDLAFKMVVKRCHTPMDILLLNLRPA